ncbi:hypothetical protein [Limimaricola cinnabarinus]|uniref:hypothetical protein n=1 Tax=Limimaricola cinnabarinus TaxID=1125964 RepID=UPI002FE28228
MTQLQIEIGAAPDDGTGDPLRTAFTKLNQNAAEAEARLIGLEKGGGGLDSVAELAASAAGSSGDKWVIRHPLIGGVFEWVTGDQSTKITADPRGGVYVAPSAAPTGASGCWKRVYDRSGGIHAAWFGVDPTPGIDNTAAMQAVFDLAYEDAYISSWRRQGLIILPYGRIECGNLTISDAYSMKVRGAGGKGATRLIFRTDYDGYMFDVTKFISLEFEDIEFAVSTPGATASTRTRHFMNYRSSGGGTEVFWTRCKWEGFGTVHKIADTVNADNFHEVNCTYENNYHGYDTTISTQALSIRSDQCQLLRFAAGGGWLYTGGSGQVEITTPTIIGDGALLKFKRSASYGAASNYLVKNAKMEWHRGQNPSANPKWIALDAATGHAVNDYKPTAEIVFENCVLSGNSNGDGDAILNALSTMDLTGRMRVTWRSGHYEGGVNYERTTWLTNLVTSNGRDGIVSFIDARRAPVPSALIESGGGLNTGVKRPIWLYQRCGNVYDMTFGGSEGVIQTMPMVNAVSPVSNRRLLQGTVQDFELALGAPQILRKATVILSHGEASGGGTSTSEAGTKTFSIYSNAGYSALIGQATTTATASGTVVEIALDAGGEYFAGTLYLRTENTLSGAVYGRWLLETLPAM